MEAMGSGAPTFIAQLLHWERKGEDWGRIRVVAFVEGNCCVDLRRKTTVGVADDGGP